MAARPFKISFCVALLCLAGPATVCVRASKHGCIYVNNDSNNQISRFRTNPTDGTLTFLDLIPTGGMGVNQGYFAIPRMATTALAGGQGCLFAPNAATHDVSAFRYDYDT